MKRACGMLLPVASLPSEYGIGAFSKEAYAFVDQLAAAGQRYWQILPLGPTGSVTLVQHYPKTTPVIFWSLSILISLMTERQSVRFSSRVKVS